jgi:ribonuclease J
LREVDATIHAPKLVAAIIKDKFDDHKLKNYKINEYDPDKDVLTIGSFKITPFRVTHSIPDTVGFSIDTPEGQVFHVAEYKFDPEPATRQLFDVEKAKKLASKGVLFLASDCLGSNKPGSVESEKPIEGRLDSVIKKADGRVFFTTISSSIGRFQYAINVAEKNDRKVTFVGWSTRRKAEIAHDLGYLKYKNGTVIDLKQALKLQKDNVMFIISGAFGQVGSALFRVATNDHPMIRAEEGDMVVFSQDPAPAYTKEAQDFMVDNFIDMGVDVHYYGVPEGLHVSGHCYQDGITRLFEIVKPKYFIPTGGTVRFMHGYRKLAEKFGAPSENIFELKPGESVEFVNGEAKRGRKVETGDVMVDGLGIGDVGNVVLRDRRLLAAEGIAIVIIQYDKVNKKLVGNIDIISRGFVFNAKRRGFLEEAARRLKNRIEKRGSIDKPRIKGVSIDFLEKYFYKEIGRRPMVLPFVIEVH